MLKKLFVLFMSAVMLVACFTGCTTAQQAPVATEAPAEAPAAAAPEAATEAAPATAEAAPAYDFEGQELTFVVPYSDSSGTNAIWRGFAPALEEVTGCKVIFDNRAGASGSVGTQYVLNTPSDGKTILTTSESTTLYHAQNLIDADYDDFEPLVLVSANCGILVTYPGSQFDGMDFNQVIEYIKAHPGEVTVGGTGLGGMAWVWWKLLTDEYDLDMIVVDYESSGDGNAQLMGGHIDLFVNGYTTGKPLIDGGKVVAIATLDKERLAGIDIPCISEYTEAFDSYMPYGSFFIAEVKADTPADQVTALRAAFMDAFNSDTFQTFINANSGRVLGLTGEEANAYAKHQQAVISWMLYDSGSSTVEPTTYGVERPVA